MSSNGERYNQNWVNSRLNIEIQVERDRTELLRGLDFWLQLNLISEAQVKDICQQHLSCALPEVKTVAAIQIGRETAKIVKETTVNVSSPPPNAIEQLWQSFVDELSIRWLLFSGIFLVVVSSAVLAATQWNNVLIIGRYLILFIYTLGFWGVGYMASQQAKLKLTSQTLKALVILLIPINFWAIDRFGLGNNIFEWLVIAIAAIILTSIVYLQFKNNRERYFIPYFVLLSYLHLVWQIDFMPLVAIYGGILSISSIHYFSSIARQQYSTTKLLFLVSAWFLLLLRELLDNAVSSNYLLAIAVFGWLLASIYLSREIEVKTNNIERKTRTVELNIYTFLSNFFQTFSIIIFTVTWLLSLIAGISQPLFFWQNLGISILAINLFAQKLTLYWRKRDLTAIFVIGLQAFYLAKELIPLSFRTAVVSFSMEISRSEYFPESILGVTLFPYIIVWIAIATWLYRRQKTELARYAESLTLLLGIGLTCLCYVNPLWRSLNLLLSTLTLAYVASIRQPLRISLIYLTHLLGLITACSAIAAIFPDLERTVWGSLLSLLAVAEWTIYLDLVRKPRIKFNSNYLLRLQQSCWYFGLLLATIGYSLLLSQSNSWGLVWLIVPGMLTLTAKYTRNIRQRRLVTILSCITLVAAQLLILERGETRFIGLSMAIGLMFVNALNCRRTAIATVHLGFGLSLIASICYVYVTGWNWLAIAALNALSLVRLRQYLQQKMLNTPKFAYISQRVAHGRLGVGTEPINRKLISKYIQAADYWTVSLMAIAIAGLSIIYLNLYLTAPPVYLSYLITIPLIATAIIWRYRQQPNNLVLYTLVWLAELLVAGLVVVVGGNNLTLAIANIFLGLLSFKFSCLTAKSSAWGRLTLAYVPLVYGTIGMLMRLSYFNAYTGLLTLGTALILLGVELEAKPTFNSLAKYIAFTGISLGIYELVIYRVRLLFESSTADSLTILALVAAAIAFSYRLGAWWYRQRQQTHIFTLSLSQFIAIAHVHWAISSMLKIVAAGVAIRGTTPYLTPISIVTSFCLGAYALIQGKDERNDASDRHTAKDWWVYVGLVEIAATLVYSRLIITKLSLFDPLRVIFTCAVALIIYQIPWHSFGWRVTPWRRTALVIPALMALVTTEDISYLSLIATAVFYLRIAYRQKNIRWSYLSLGFIDWTMFKLLWQLDAEFIWLAAIVSLSILYLAQFDPKLKSHRQPRHYVRIAGSSILCVAALFYPNAELIPGLISLSLIFMGLGFKIRAFLFVGTITLVLTVIDGAIALVLAYSFLKWIVGLLVGVCLIAVAAGFEKRRGNLADKLLTHINSLENWQ